MAMAATDFKHIGYDANGKHVVQVTVVADTTPASLPTTGADITGMTADDVFAPMSVLYVAGENVSDRVYVADASGVFRKQ